VNLTDYFFIFSFLSKIIDTAFGKLFQKSSYQYGFF